MGALAEGFDAPTVARLFLDVVVKHHGFPEEIISDRDRVFMNVFWQELLKLSGTKLKFSTAYHPQTDGQTEVTNRSIEQYLRAFASDRPGKWFSFLPWAELALNCGFHAEINMSPFQALYGREPPNLFPTMSTSSQSPTIEELLVERAKLLTDLKQHLRHTQQRMAAQANKHRRDVSFDVGDMVLLKLQPYRQHSVARITSAKLARRFYWQFPIIEKIGKVAYRLQLPIDSLIHNVFHVSLLRPFRAAQPVANIAPLPPYLIKGRPLSEPVRALAARTVLADGTSQEQWLIEWSDGTDTTWEPRSDMQRLSPSLRLEDKVIPIPESVVTNQTQQSNGSSPSADEEPND